VGKGLEALSQGLAESNYLARAREQIIDRLHTENEKLRAGVLEQAMGPVLRDLMRLYDDLARTAEAYASREPREAESTVRDWASYRDVVEDILYRQGVEPVETAPGDPFDPRLHRAVGPEDTPERTLEKAVARVVRPGFQSGSRILRPAEVRVFRYAAPQGPVEPVEEHQQKEERS
jgi:molecular chaperone GrpE (heat shock protein)